MKYTIALFASSLVGITAFSQTPRKITIYDAGVSAGSLIYNNTTFSTEDWQQLSPEFKDLTDPAYGYKLFSNYSGRTDVSSYGLHVQLALPVFKEDQRSQLLWGFSLNKAGSSVMQTEYSKLSGGITDSLYSANAGAYTTFVHSDTTTYIGYLYKADRLLFGTRLVYHTDPGKIVSAYAGVAVQLGISTNAQTEYFDMKQINQYQNGEADPEPRENYQYYYGTDQSTGYVQKSTVRQKACKYYGASVPVGVSFRLGKTNPVLSRLSLDLEFAAGFMTAIIPDVKTYSSVTYNGLIRLNYRLS